MPVILRRPYHINLSILAQNEGDIQSKERKYFKSKSNFPHSENEVNTESGKKMALSLLVNIDSFPEEHHIGTVELSENVSDREIRIVLKGESSKDVFG